MKSYEVRNAFLKFFKDKGHKIVASAPIVVKDDPTLMFTNAGMNQFKDIFLGNKSVDAPRIADTQKCLRVSGKHNDLEEVGVDTYHHTMFEMLGNWSFGDYFKAEAIAWAWELMTEVYKLPKERLYVTVFEGDVTDGIAADEESLAIWKKFVAEDHILFGNKKDNFWEMGDTGPCGSSSEIHIDLRPQSEIDKIPGKDLVNNDHDQVIELWNLVFIEFNRKADGSLELLPNKHVDTGMGFERIVRAINSMKSNYDSDVFMDLIHHIAKISGLEYGKSEKTDIAFRVIADHCRAVSLCIADGQLPDNTGAGYVIRRILRRAIRYGYSYLNLEKPFIYELVSTLSKQFKEVFPELHTQESFVQKVIEQEEKSFLNTLNNGLKRFEKITEGGATTIAGNAAFELYDTYGFPIDLTELLAREKGINVDIQAFEAELAKQKDRSKADAEKTQGDWMLVQADEENFVGYDFTKHKVKITRYREISTKGKTYFQIILNQSPFYAESGGQVGDTGTLIGTNTSEEVQVFDTIKENKLTILLINALPKEVSQEFSAEVNVQRRADITKNHSATHLLHAALKNVLGAHVNQKGSLVNEKYLRFDFSHFQKVESGDLQKIEQLVNEKIKAAIPLVEKRDVKFEEALKSGATALFGEKYGDTVRVIAFDPEFSQELCGGTHVHNTSEISQFKIISESAVAAGVRRIEALSATGAEALVAEKLLLLEKINNLLGNPQDNLASITHLQSENVALKKQIAYFEEMQAAQLKKQLLLDVKNSGDFSYLVSLVDLSNNAQAKDLVFQLKNEIEQLFCVLLCNVQGKPSITIGISDKLVETKKLNAGALIRDWAKAIKGGGGGQPFYAQAGGSDITGLPMVAEMAEAYIETI